MDHTSNVCHVMHLEDFSSEEILRAKHRYEWIALACSNIVCKFRSDNGRFSDRAFLEDMHSLG